MSTADHPQTDGQTERANRVVADVLRTVATPKEWSKQFSFVDFAINDSVHAVRVRHRFMLTDCAILGRQFHLCAARVFVGRAPHQARCERGQSSQYDDDPRKYHVSDKYLL